MLGAWERWDNDPDLICLLLLNGGKCLFGIVLSREPTRDLPTLLLWVQSSSDVTALLKSLPKPQAQNTLTIQRGPQLLQPLPHSLSMPPPSGPQAHPWLPHLELCLWHSLYLKYQATLSFKGQLKCSIPCEGLPSSPAPSITLLLTLQEPGAGLSTSPGLAW